MKTLTLLPLLLLAAPAPAADAPVRKALNPANTLFLETEGARRRVVVESEVCLREGQLELLLCRKMTKEHEAVLAADVDARQVHAALLACGAKPGSPVKFQPKFEPASGSVVKVTLRYQKDGKTVTVPAREWIKHARTGKDLATDWVFAGSVFVPDPDEPNKPPYYAANSGDVICVSNFADAMLDLPVASPMENAELAFEANTARIPPLKTKVTVILEPVAGK